MSIPITACLVMRAIRGSDTASEELQRRLTEGKAHGAFSVWPCRCMPPCDPPTNEQIIRWLRLHPRLSHLIDELL